MENRNNTIHQKPSTNNLHLYDDWFFQHTIYWQGPAAFTVAKAIFDRFHPTSLVDVGCGAGIYLIQWRLIGVDVVGLEGSDAGVNRCLKQGLEVHKFDLTRPVQTSRRFDLAVSFEVAEHLPPSSSFQFVKTLTQLAPIIVFTAATPGQGGYGHINEKPLGFWDALFAKLSFSVDTVSTDYLTGVFKEDPNTNHWLLNNLRCYVDLTKQ